MRVDSDHAPVLKDQAQAEGVRRNDAGPSAIRVEENKVERVALTRI